MIIKRAASINARRNRSLLVITNSLLEEICFTLKRDQHHPIKWIHHKLDILTHQVTIHPHQRARERVAHKLPLDLDRVADNRLHALLRELHPQEGIDQAREVAVQAFVS